MADNRIYLGVVILVVIWAATFSNMFGLRGAGRLATAGVIMATIVPALVVIVMGLDFLISGGKLQLNVEGGAAFVPDSSTFDLIVPGYTAFLALEVTAVFVRRLRSPSKQYPHALLIAGITSFVLLVGVALVIMSALPTDAISSEAGIMSTITALSEQTRLGFLIPLTAVSITLGWIGLASNIFIGPATGLLATARYGHLPEFLTRENSKGAPVPLLVTQGIIASAVTLVFLSFSNTQVAFEYVVTLATMIYAIMYILMYSAAIKLRRTRPDLERPFWALGRNNLWITLLCIWAIVMAFVIIANGFIPNSEVTDQPGQYLIAIAVGFILLAVLPLLVDRSRKGPPPLSELAHVQVDVQEGESFLDETSTFPAVKPGVPPQATGPGDAADPDPDDKGSTSATRGQ